MSTSPNKPGLRPGFTLAWSFRNRPETIQRSMRSAHATCPTHVNFALVDAASTQETLQTVRATAAQLAPRDVRIAESAFRTNLGEAWNLALMLSDTRYVIFASSDVEFFDPRWFGALESTAAQGYEYVLIENHAVFMVDKKIIPRLGWFDENFGLGPHFDCDFMIRASEAGIRFCGLPNPQLYHHGDDRETTARRLSGEQPNRLPMNDLQNEEYFRAKWSSAWPGWANVVDKTADLPHPPTHISQARRRLAELDPHPFYTSKYR